MKPTAHTRQVANIGRDTTQPQLINPDRIPYLHGLPINSKRRDRYNPAVLITTYTIAGFIGFAVAGAIISLVLNGD